MNIKLISMFQKAPFFPKNLETFKTVNSYSIKAGYLVHPDCCSQNTLDWAKKQKINTNSIFYKFWRDIVSKNELVFDQILNYLTDNVSNSEEVPLAKFKVIMPATEEEIFSDIIKVLRDGVAVDAKTTEVFVDFVRGIDKKL